MSEKTTTTIDKDQLLLGIRKLSIEFEVNQIRLVDIEKRHARTDMNSSRWGELVSRHSQLLRDQNTIAQAVDAGCAALALETPPAIALWMEMHPIAS